jgi:hypothetical protein
MITTVFVGCGGSSGGGTAAQSTAAASSKAESTAATSTAAESTAAESTTEEAAVPAGETYTLMVANHDAATSMCELYVETICNMMSEESGGRLQFVFNPGGSLLGGTETIDGVKDGEHYQDAICPSINSDTILLNGQAYESGTVISSIGYHKIKIYGAGGYVRELSFTIDVQVDGVENNTTYNSAITPIINTDRVVLNGDEYTSGTAISEVGNYVLKISGENGYFKEIVFTIADEGPGIPDEAKTRIFNKFYQGDGAHKEKGNGLGLALAKRIVDINKGAIGVENLAERGCQFIVILKNN